MGLDRDGDDEHDEKHEQNVDQRRHVHVTHWLSFAGAPT
jgi:hypothetical protein